MKQKNSAAFPPRDHDHNICLADALWRAKTRCAEMGIKWTGLREQVFRQIAGSHKPVSAYDLIEGIAQEGRRLAPVSVYRILDVLQAAGLVHRLESRSAFFACMTEHPNVPQTITFVCDDCERVSEIDAPDAIGAIGRTSEATRFHARSTLIEVSGVCRDCHDREGDKTSC
jgi:Fur family transcriptional regulator, zinc uptake regulator